MQIFVQIVFQAFGPRISICVQFLACVFALVFCRAATDVTIHTTSAQARTVAWPSGQHICDSFGLKHSPPTFSDN